MKNAPRIFLIIFIMIMASHIVSNVPVKGRFAPSPTGRMHAGNIFAALMAWLIAKSQDGCIVLRIEDLDRQRSRQSYIDDVLTDFEMLGLTWDEGPYFQHDREEAYRAAYEALESKGLLYPCFCSRADLHAASAPHRGEKLVYPGTCRMLTPDERIQRLKAKNPATRLAVDHSAFSLIDQIQGPYRQTLDTECGDFLIRRSDGAFAYQLAVVVDDATQGITSVVRGVDLLCSTPQQLYLQELLGYPHPEYAHVPLLVAEQDRRLSKRDHDASLEELLARYRTPARVIGHIAWLVGMLEEDAPATPEQLLETFSLERTVASFPDLVQIRWR